MNLIYFDHNATTFPCPKIGALFEPGLKSFWANPSSEHILGEQVELGLKDDKEQIAASLGCLPGQLIFTSGATESINTVLVKPTFLRNRFTSIISSPLEHHASLECIKRLEAQETDVSWLKNDENGVLDFRDLEKILKARPRGLVSLLFVNNETGVISDIEKAVELAHDYDSKIHIDAVQGLGKFEIDLFSLGVDFASFSGHKIGALKGVGLLFCKDVLGIEPLIVGGGQENGRRAGTTNTLGIRSFRLALEECTQENVKKINEIRNYFESKIEEIKFAITINCKSAPRAIGTSNVLFHGVPNQALLMGLSANNICVATGSACTSGVPGPSHVILGLRGSKIQAESSLRFSFSHSNTKEEVDRCIEVLGLLYERFSSSANFASRTDQMLNANQREGVPL